MDGSSLTRCLRSNKHDRKISWAHLCYRDRGEEKTFRHLLSSADSVSTIRLGREELFLDR
jgi:hypothetical protein